MQNNCQEQQLDIHEQQSYRTTVARYTLDRDHPVEAVTNTESPT